MTDGVTPDVPPRIAELVERMVHDASLPNVRERDALRSELTDHFADAVERGVAAGLNEASAIDRAVDRFGDPVPVVHGLRRAHVPWRHSLYAGKLTAAVAVSWAIALVVQGLVHLTRQPGLGPPFATSARVSLAVVCMVVAIWEVGVGPDSLRLERHPARLLLAVTVLLIVMAVTHARLGLRLDLGQSVLGALSLVAVWTVSVAVVERSDRLFLRALGGTL